MDIPETKTQLSLDIESAENDKTRYDNIAKHILGNKEILAHIMKNVVSEFSDMEIPDIINCIEGSPDIGTKPVYTTTIEGITQENAIPNEGKITYDVFFYAMVPSKKNPVKIFLNIEAQGSFHPGYRLVSRGIVYASRIISWQYSREYDDKNYDDLRKVYSIWICFDAAKEAQNTITRFRTIAEHICGNYGNADDYNFPVIVLIGLNADAIDAPEHELLDMLTVLFANSRTAEEREAALEERYGISKNNVRKEQIESMCNLSDGIYEKGVSKGKQETSMNSYREALKIGLSTDKARKIAGEISDENAAKVEKELGITPSAPA